MTTRWNLDLLIGKVVVVVRGNRWRVVAHHALIRLSLEFNLVSPVLDRMRVSGLFIYIGLLFVSALFHAVWLRADDDIRVYFLG